MIGFVILEGFFAIIAGIRPNFIITAIGIFGFWFSVTMINSHWQSLIQTKVGLELQGRVLATNQMIAMCTANNMCRVTGNALVDFRLSFQAAYLYGR